MIPTIDDVRRACVRSLKRETVNYLPLLRHALLRMYHARMAQALGESWLPCPIPVSRIVENGVVSVDSPWLFDDKWFNYRMLEIVARDLVYGLGFKNCHWTHGRQQRFRRTANRYFSGDIRWFPYPYVHLASDLSRFGSNPTVRPKYPWPPITQDELEDDVGVFAGESQVCWDAAGGIGLRTEIDDGEDYDYDYGRTMRYTWCPRPPPAVRDDYRLYAELYNLVKAGQLEIAADRMCDLGCAESYAYADTWRADPEVAHLSSEWLKREYDHESPEGIARAAEVAGGYCGRIPVRRGVARPAGW